MPPLRKATTSNSAKADAVAGFLSKYWVLCLVILALYPLMRKYYLMMFASIDAQQREIALDTHFADNKNPGVLKDKYDKETKALNEMNYPFQHSPAVLQTIAQELAEKLGTIYSDTDSWWCKLDPRGWFEDDIGTADLVIQYGDDMQALTQYYYQYTRKRNLLDDLIRLLNPQQKKRVMEQNQNVVL